MVGTWGGRPRSAAALLVALALLGGRGTSRAADVGGSSGPFGGDLTVDTATCRRAANALASAARQVMIDPAAGDAETPRRLIALARQIDPANARVTVYARQIEQGRGAAKGRPSPSALAHAVADLRVAARVAAASAAGPDRTLAAYLYAAASATTPGGSLDDDRQVQALSAQGYTANWAAVMNATPPAAPDRRVPPPPEASPVTPPRGPVAATAVEPPPAAAPVTPPTTEPVAARAVKEIHGLVVSRAVDGRMHGRAIEIIAAPTAQASHRVRIVGGAGREMQVSLEEAARLVQLRRPGVRELAVEISFDDKYSQKDGGSAGTAFTVLLLAYQGQFDLDPAAAVTGDITIDSKVRPVGEVAAKVHGAALDHCTRVAIPADNADQMDDAILLRGPSALWETQVFTCRTLDDAIAVLRADPDPKLTQATALFDGLRDQYQKSPPSALAAPGPAATLARILSLAPNHLSAAALQRLSKGHGPAHLTLPTTVTEAVNAAAPFVLPSRARRGPPDVVDPAVEAAAYKTLRQLGTIGDPDARPVVTAVREYIKAFVDFAGREYDRSVSYQDKDGALRHAQSQAEAVRSAVRQLIDDPDVLDRLLHNG